MTRNRLSVADVCKLVFRWVYLHNIPAYHYCYLSLISTVILSLQHSQETALVMAILSYQMIHLLPTDFILFILTHSEIYWINFPPHINAEAPAGWQFTSTAETCPRFYALASWSDSVLLLKFTLGTAENPALFSVSQVLNAVLYHSLFRSGCQNFQGLCSGVTVWNRGVKISVALSWWPLEPAASHLSQDEDENSALS